MLGYIRYYLTLSSMLMVLSIAFCSNLKLYPYNEVNFIEFQSTEALVRDVFNFNGEELSRTNIFLGVAKPECLHLLEAVAFRGAQRHAGGDVVLAATVPFEGFPYQLNGCAELFFYPIASTFDNPRERTIKFDHVDLTSWTSEMMRTKISMKNNFDFTIELYWNDEKRTHNQGILRPGHEINMSSRLGHVFSVAREKSFEGDSEENTDIVDFMVVNGLDYHFQPTNRIETCEVIPDQIPMFVDGDIACSDLHKRFAEFSNQVWHQKRLGLNYVQPQLVRPVTQNGFELRQLPADTYAWLREWYLQMQAIQEVNETKTGPCMNQYVAPSQITHLDALNKERLTEDLRPILEGWYGGELTRTSIYGIRKYVNGSVLRMHVDTVNTHVVSAIINVDQDVEEDWPLVILDHEGNERSVIMKAGDMLLYESAKLLHGRPSVFNGAHYDNIFIHYKPVSGWDYSWI